MLARAAWIRIASALCIIAGAGAVWAEEIKAGANLKPRYEFANGSTPGWADSHRCYICRGVWLNGTLHLDERASDLLRIYGPVGSEVTVTLNDATGVVVFAEEQSPVVITIKGPGDANGIGKVEILLRSTTTAEVTDPAFTIVVKPPDGPVFQEDTLGAIGFELEGKVGEVLDDTTGYAGAFAPNGPAHDTGKATYVRAVQVNPIPNADSLHEKPTVADFGAIGVFEYRIRLEFTAVNAINAISVVVNRAYLLSAFHGQWNTSDKRTPYGVSIAGDLPPARVFARWRPLEPWVWHVLARQDTLPIGHWIDLMAVADVEANAAGNSSAEIYAFSGSGALSARYILNPYCPF